MAMIVTDCYKMRVGSLARSCLRHHLEVQHPANGWTDWAILHSRVVFDTRPDDGGIVRTLSVIVISTAGSMRSNWYRCASSIKIDCPS